MRFFKKRNRQTLGGSLSQRLETYVDQRQRRLANYLNVKTRHASSNALLYGLIIFCTVFGSYLLYLLVGAFGAFN